MSRRKDANRAEEIVKLIGALMMLLLLAVMLFALPHILKGKSPQEMMHTLLSFIVAFAGLSIVIGIIGLIVWLKVMRRK